MTSQAEWIEKIRSSFKNPSQRAATGFLAEMDIFHKLQATGVPFIRSYEGASVDGAFFCGSREKIEAFHERFRPEDSYEKWKWATETKSARFITFDVKYVSLRPSRTKMQDYSFTEITGTNHNEKAEVYLLCFEGIAEYTAIVPKVVWETATNLTHGIDPLISKIPAWCFLFMVHDRDLKSAISQMIATSAGEDVQVKNPTTGISLTGYRPKSTQEAALTPTQGGHVRARLSYEAVAWFWRVLSVVEPAVKIHFNPLAPLVCDFLLELPGIPEALTVEAKLSRALAIEGAMSIEKGEKRSPFATFRQWHFMLVQAGANRDSFVCIGRHEVQADWVDKVSWTVNEYRRFLFQGEHAIRDIIRYIYQNYHNASRKVREVTALADEISVALEYLITSNAADRMDDETNDMTLPNKLTSQVFHQPGLPWVAQLLNEQCRRAERGVCFALDTGHPVSTHAMVDYAWTSQQGEDYDLEGILPVLPFSRDAMELPCVALDLIDLSGAKDGFLLGMREHYWTRLALRQQFITIGSILKARDLIPTTNHWYSNYLMFPSEFLARIDFDLREAVSGDGYNGQNFFNRITQGENAANPEFWKASRTDVEPLRKGSRLLAATHRDVDPLEHLVSLQGGGILAQIFEIFGGDDEMSIKGFQNVVPNKSFLKAPYRTTLKALHQVSWDYGLKRKPGSLDE